MMDAMKSWTLTIYSRMDETGEPSTITVTEDGTVTTTGDGDRWVEPGIVYDRNGPIPPAEGLRYLVALGTEIGRGTTFYCTLEGPGFTGW